MDRNRRTGNRRRKNNNNGTNSSRRKGGNTTTTTTKKRNKVTTKRRTNTSSKTKLTPTKRKKRITEKRFDKHKFSNPFSNKKKRFRTSFGSFYESGEIPCRIKHGGSMTNITLRWDKDISSVPYNPYLVYFADGLRETEHPYVVLASVGFKELVQSEGSREKVVQVLPKIIPLLRKAFQSPNIKCFERAMAATTQLSNCVDEELNAHLNTILIQLSKKAFNRKYSQKITAVLNTIEENSGKSVTALIKSKVPTYTSVFFC